jgi:hypothetical protein
VFDVGDQVVVLVPDSDQKIYSRWIPAVVKEKVSPYSYIVLMEDGSERKLHANKLRIFKQRINALGVVFEGDEDFGEIECAPSISDSQCIESNIQVWDLGHLSDEKKQLMGALLDKHHDVFSDKPGKCSVGQHTIRVQEGFVPKRMPPYRIPETLRKEVDKQIQELLDLDLIEPSESPHAYPIVCVTKPNNSIRMCCDFRILNSATVDDRYPMRNAQDLIFKVGKGRFITTLDCCQGYYQIPMDSESIPKTAFITHNGQFQWKVMSFGLKNAGATYQRTMDKLLEKHREYATAYIDDIAIFSNTFEEHLVQVEAVLLTLKQAGITLRIEKCKFAQSTVMYLGHKVGCGMHQAGDKKISAVRNIKRPDTKRELKTFLGLCNYYRSYVENFSEIALPLTYLTKARLPQKLEWGELQQKAFETLKAKLCEQPVLRTPDWSRSFIIQADASDFAVAACLAQNFDSQDGGLEEHPIAFASSKLTDTQRNWAIIEKEAYAIIFALKTFDPIVFGCKITIFSDHNPLQYLAQNAPKSSKLTRWYLSLQRYDYIIVHRKGTDNANCDALSRLL